MTKYIVLAVALVLMVGGCESEAPESVMDVDAGPVGSSDCGTAGDAMAEADSAPVVSPVLPHRATYDVSFARTSDYEPGSCGFDFDWFVNRLLVEGSSGAWVSDLGEGLGERAELTIARSGSSFITSPADHPGIGIHYPFGPCAATVAADGSWRCEMYRHWVEADGAVKCFNRYRVTGTPLP